MKKQSRALGAIPYGCEPVLHGICEVDPTKSLRECVGDLPLYAVMNFLMRITVKLEEPITGAVSTEEHAYYQEPLPKAMCTTPLSLRADMTPPGTDFTNQGAAINGSLPMPPRLTGSDAPAVTTVIEARDASSDDSSSVLENRDCLFMLSLRPKKNPCLRVTRTGREYDAWLLSLSPQEPLTTNRFLTLQKSFLWEFMVTPNIFAAIQRSSQWNNTLAHLCDYVYSLNSLDLKRVHPCHHLYLPVLNQLQAWCTLLKCAEGAPLFDGYRARLTSKVSSLVKKTEPFSTNTSDADGISTSLEDIIQTGRRLEEFVINAYTLYSYE